MLIQILIGGDEMAIVAVYVSLILKEKRTFDSVPAGIKQQAADMLIDIGAEHLITDEAYLPKTEE